MSIFDDDDPHPQRTTGDDEVVFDEFDDEEYREPEPQFDTWEEHRGER